MIANIMLEFAETTGLLPESSVPKRYLWTDAFAVCNFLGLYAGTRDEQWKDLALSLISHVHTTLGRHRADDLRTGWISGLDEEQGRLHPTIGGLRIGKKMNERPPGEAIDEVLEWDRDGQYFHYLTQWMHALDCTGRITGARIFNLWAVELAKAVHAKFSYRPYPGSEKRLYWKMSIDLSFPLVSSMGHHDPLDGLITYSELQATHANNSRSSQQDLQSEIDDMAKICSGKSWVSDDALGIGGLLTGAYRIAQLIAIDGFATPELLKVVLKDSITSMEYFSAYSPLRLPASHRLAFREFGLSIGLQAIRRLQKLMEQSPSIFDAASRDIERLLKYSPLVEQINSFWNDDKNRKSAGWTGHREINMVMLATSLSPDGYLAVRR